MTNESPAGHSPSSLEWLLTDFIARVPHTFSVVLTSSDGITKVAHGLDADQADRLSAIATSLCSLGRGVGDVCEARESHEHRKSGKVRQVVVEHDLAVLFVSSAGTGTILGLLASPACDAGVVGYEIGQLVKSVSDHLATQPRLFAPSPGTIV
ncbi:roadblock/LC7 domain-containing protein [Streptomyces sp. NPDC020681]|uniref:roadblock/LC7 domain-containing protein n=1 Tax=Streptomyces sp. NPDC020681 TaxID=3365083 RepID=UPI0037BA0D37